MLNYFMHRRGRIISQSELLDHLYSQETGRDPNTIEVCVSRLRRKLGRDAIKTLRGLGYRFGSDE
jgi:DNA-binding response OmpR family regulator